ncbi:uncharacterized protein LOC107304313 [Oryza brachyantha]|uniref:uncharacterized protein LOC107304313 n=1 Tax=Oryza brachyantha TaxID=4533 RepID=UPI0007769887|nr:uncharacterized protein LOC107304313 [Oryza brachyantha]
MAKAWGTTSCRFTAVSSSPSGAQLWASGTRAAARRSRGEAVASAESKQRQHAAAFGREAAGAATRASSIRVRDLGGISFLEAPIHNGVDPKIPDNRPTAAPSMSILEDTRHPGKDSTVPDGRPTLAPGISILEDTKHNGKDPNVPDNRPTDVSILGDAGKDPMVPSKSPTV